MDKHADDGSSASPAAGASVPEWWHEAEAATALGDEIAPDPEEARLSPFSNQTLLVLAVVAHAHGISVHQLRQATGSYHFGIRWSLRELRRSDLVQAEHRPGPDLWFTTLDGSRLGVTPYVVRVLDSARPRYTGVAAGGFSVFPFRALGSEHGPPIFRPSWALANVEDVDELAEVIRTGTHDDRVYALSKLVALHDPRSVSVLSEVAQRHGDAEPLARSATIALGSFDTPESVDVLIDIAANRDSYMREAAAISLGRLRSSAAVPTLEALLEYPSTPVRVAAVRALGRVGDGAAVDALTLALDDSDGAVRRGARQDLIRMGAATALRQSRSRSFPLRSIDVFRANRARSSRVSDSVSPTVSPDEQI